ncbi:MAG: M13 family metallopeptidase [Lachnospiraceae bacterium]|nr:M13 family metallopeptidase [Lachnospiraceae bacterium]
MRKRTVALIAAVAISAVTLAGCGSQGPLSDIPGGGKWVDSDIIGNVDASSDIRLQDDFAAAANKDWIINAPSKQELADEDPVLNRYMDIINDEGLTGANADVMKTFAGLALNWEERDRLGAEPLRRYLEPIENISSIDDLTAYQGSLADNPFGIGLLMLSKVGPQLQFTDQNTLFLSAPSYSLRSREAYLSFGADTLEAKSRNDLIVRSILNRLGYSDSEITRILNQNYEIETALAKIENKDFYSTSETFNQVQTDREGLSAYTGAYPLFEILDQRGYSGCDSLNVDYMYLAGLSGIYTEKNLESLKSFLIVHLINGTRFLYDREYVDKIMEAELSRTKDNSDTILPGDNRLFQTALSACGYLPLMDTLYLEKYFPDEDSCDMYVQMTQDLMDSYSFMLGEEDWISGDTASAAREKLDNMVMCVIRPDNTADYSDVVIKGYEDGGNLLDAAAEGRRELNRHFAQMASNESFDRSFWDIYDTEQSTTQINSYYSPSQNAIFILAGWIADAEDRYGTEASFEQLLGGVGSVVGHEISHGFDADGSHYDKDGRVYDDNGEQLDWMSEEDRSRLNERADALAGYFSLARPVPGKQQVNGQNVKNEAIADMAGMKAVLYMVKNIPDFDYDSFFRAYAALWRMQTEEKNELQMMGIDVHPLNFHRINITLQQFDEFYETYDIKPGDGMYLAPEKRINVW